MHSKNKTIKNNFNHKQRVIFAIIVLIIPLLNYAVFMIGMNGEMFISSFFSSRRGGGQITTEFVGLHNYRVLFRNLTDMTGNEAIPFVVLRNTLSIVPVSILTTCISLIMSYAIARKFFGHRIFKVVLYAPSILSTVVLCMIFKYLCMEGGVIYELFGKNIPGGMGLFGNNKVWKVVIAFTVWTGCIVNLYFMSAFARLPESAFESAQLDGASEPVMFFNIAFPLVSSLFVTLLLSSICGAFGFFAPVYFLTKGSQKEAHTLGYMLVTFAQSNTSDGDVGIHAALGVVITVIGSLIAILTRWVGSKLAVEDLEY